MDSALRAYEMGRVRTAIVRAACVSAAVLVIGVVLVGRAAAPWALAPLAVLALTEWRGGSLSHGARRGALAGLVVLLLPSSILRPCCDATMAATGVCCTMPSVCGIAGVFIGVAMQLVWPKERSPRTHVLAGVGVACGALSVLSARCAGLFVGEAIGLVLGLVAGVATSSAARVWIASRRAGAPT